MLSEAWAELSPPKRKERWRRNEEDLVQEGGRVQVRRGKNPRQGESLDKDKHIQRQNRQYNYKQAR